MGSVDIGEVPMPVPQPDQDDMALARAVDSHREHKIPRVVWGVGSITGGFFLAIQSALALDAASAGNLRHHAVVAIAGGIVAYLGFAFVGVFLAARGRGFASMIPAAAYALSGIVLSSAHEPTPIGSAWSLPCEAGCSSWFDPWVGALVDLTLIAIPIAIASRYFVKRRLFDRSDWMSWISIGVSLGVVAVTYRTVAVLDGPPERWAVLTVIAYGLLAGLPRPRWLLAHVLVAAATAGTTAAWFAGAVLAPSKDFGLAEGVPYFTSAFMPLFGLTISASLWQPIRSSIDRLVARPRALLLLVNLLNIADALLTEIAIRNGRAVELNPFVRYGGVPAKIVLVAAASVLIYRLQRRALVWPMLVLLLVFAYHLTGLFVPN